MNERVCAVAVVVVCSSVSTLKFDIIVVNHIRRLCKLAKPFEF